MYIFSFDTSALVENNNNQKADTEYAGNRLCIFNEQLLCHLSGKYVIPAYIVADNETRTWYAIGHSTPSSQ